MLRALFLEYPEDPMAWYQDTEYFLGDSIFVAPIFNTEGRVQYYLPKGDWYGIIDQKMRTGGGYITEEHDYFSSPVLLRPGSSVFQSKNAINDSVVYDWGKDVRLLVNWVQGMRTTAKIADHESPCGFKTVIDISSEGDQLKVEVVEGKLVGSMDIVVVNKSIDAATSGLELVDSSTLRAHEGFGGVSFRVI